MAKLRDVFLRIKTARIFCQSILFLLFNSVFLGFEPLPLVLPILQSLGNPQATVGDAFATIQYMLYEAAFPWLPLASFFIIAAILGKALCGWACPFGFVQDILSYVKRKHMEFSTRTHQDLVYVKYGVLIIVMAISVTVSAAEAIGIVGYKTTLGVFAQAPFNSWSPHDTLFATLPTMAFQAIFIGSPALDIIGAITSLTPLFWVRLAILALVLVFAVYTPRGWCRYLCPVGAAIGFLNHFSFLGLRRDVVHCTKESCRICVEVCPTKVPILDLPWEKFTHPECTYCLDCVDACKSKAIKPKFP